MGGVCAPGRNLAGAALLFAAAGCAFAQSPRADFSYLDASWCTAPHDDYRPGRFVVDIRQIRQIRVRTDPRTGAPKEVLAQLRSAVVDARTGQVEFAGGWMEFGFRVVDQLTLKDPVVDVTLTTTPERNNLVYAYGDSRPHTYTRCGPASAQLTEKDRLPAGIKIEPAPAAAAESKPAPAGTASPTQAERDQPGNSVAQSADQPTPYANLSHCLSLGKMQGGFLSLVNRCSQAVNYTYCLLNPTTSNGRFFVCRTVKGRQIGQGSGSVDAGGRGYLGLPGNERGRIVWFACEPPGIPALTSANPSQGRCQ